MRRIYQLHARLKRTRDLAPRTGWCGSSARSILLGLTIQGLVLSSRVGACRFIGVLKH